MVGLNSSQQGDERLHDGNRWHGWFASTRTVGRHQVSPPAYAPEQGSDQGRRGRQPCAPDRSATATGTVFRSVSMPPRLPKPADELIGSVLWLASGDCRYLDYPLTLRVTRVRVEISLWYDGDWVWLEGDALDASGRVIARTPALVAVTALA